ncbi:AAA family ATPase [Anaerovibrio sp.]|uniref:AAA family ATPase n=1 Tax=Anaerovibrio sp. TaxID=1872532 RepID=UPI0025C73E68|nr:AAA family ATPase [Anaerovibrio sp.]MBR2142534.1 AAA family ATPase [Anaerovibrio sp.]
MLIKEIELENFKSFKGTHHIDFATDSVKNVTVVMGDNGAGKTTLEQAFVWCLYGEVEGLGDNLLNYDIQNELIYGQVSKVCMKVKLLVEFRGQNHRISRFQDLVYKYNKVGVDGNYFIVDKQDENGSWVRLKHADSLVFIKKLLPQELSGFFFFDGEHLDRMSTELLQKKKSNNFKDAVRGLVGLTALRNTLSHLGPATKKRTVCGNFNSEINSGSDDRIRELSNKIDTFSEAIEKNEKEVENLEIEIERHEGNRADWQQQLSNLQDDVNRKKQYDDLEKKIVDNEKRENALVGSLFKDFAKNFGTEISQPFFKEALEEIKSVSKTEETRPYIPVDTIKFLLNAKECICGCKLEEGSEESKHLMSLMEDLPSDSLRDNIVKFSTSIRARLRNIGEFKNNFEQYIIDKNNYNEEARKASDDRRMLEDTLKDTSQVENLRKKIDGSTARIKDYRARVKNYRNNIARDEMQRKSAQTTRNSLLAACEKNRKNITYYNYANFLYEMLSNTYMKKERDTRRDLEVIINEIFDDIYDGDIQIAVDDEYRITSTLKDVLGGGGNLARNTAQNYAIIFAFIVGIIKLVKINRGNEDGYPLVMDAPLSSFDEKRIKQICQTIPEIAKQIIIFIKDTDGKIAEQHLSGKIGARYDLKPISKTQSIIEQR